MKEIVMAAVVALALGGQQTGVQQQAAQQTGQQAVQQAKTPLPDAPTQQPQQAGQIPDAPKPQTLGLGPVTPGRGTTPTSNGESGSASAGDPDQQVVGATLPPTEKAPPDNATDAAPDFASEASMIGSPLVIRTNLVEVPFTVKDNKGHLVPGLTYRDVHVYENNVRQHMLVFTVDPHPLSVAVVIDQSLGFHDMEKVNNALGALQGAFTPYDEVAVFTYNNGPKMVTNFTAGQSNRLAAAIERSKAPGREQGFYDTSGPMTKGISINGGANRNETPLSEGGPASPQGVRGDTIEREVHTLNDAIFLAAQATTKAGKGRRRIVYVISDGKEYGSKIKTKDLLKYLEQNKVEVCATLVGDSSVSGMGFIDTLHLPLMMRDNILPVYTKATGGLFYADYRQKSIEASFAQITEDVRTQYTAWYSSREPMIDGKFRKVEVRVLRPNLQVIAKDGYYPSVEDQSPQVLMSPGKPKPATPATVPQ